MSQTNPCPICDKPIADTAYVCHGCTRHLAKALLRAAAELSELEVTLARQDVVDAQVGSGAMVAKAYEGPWCVEMCDHISCRQALDTQCFVALREHRERPLGHEGAVPYDTGASEALAIIGNTIGTWARHVSETRGTPIPTHDLPQVAEVEPVGSGPRKGGDAAYCTCCDLPLEFCFTRRTA